MSGQAGMQTTRSDNTLEVQQQDSALQYELRARNHAPAVAYEIR